MKPRTEISWWIPGGSITYSGSPKPRSEWIRLTWRSYMAFWRLFMCAGYLAAKHQLSSPAASKPQDATATTAARNIKNDAGEAARKETN